MPWTKSLVLVSTQWIALRKRYDRCGAGTDCAADASGERRRRNFHRPHRFKAIFTLGTTRDDDKKIVTALVLRACRKLGRKPRSTAAVIDSRSTDNPVRRTARLRGQTYL